MADRSLKIVVEKGPAAGAEAVLAGRGLTIGRDPGADLVLPADEFVSPQHIRIVWSDRGAMLRNHSPNGTLVNGRSVSEAALADGDTISVGLLHLLGVRGGQPAAARAAVPRGAAPAKAASAPAPGVKLPVWLIGYLVLMLLVFAFFGMMRLRGTAEAGLSDVVQQEQQYAGGRSYQRTETDRIARLLETALVHERRGDARSAYEVYRELMSVRRPVDPRSPAYRYAASRVAALGPR
jgi:hypothetical protein